MTKPIIFFFVGMFTLSQLVFSMNSVLADSPPPVIHQPTQDSGSKDEPDLPTD